MKAKNELITQAMEMHQILLGGYKRVEDGLTQQNSRPYIVKDILKKLWALLTNHYSSLIGLDPEERTIILTIYCDIIKLYRGWERSLVSYGLQFMTENQGNLSIDLSELLVFYQLIRLALQSKKATIKEVKDLSNYLDKVNLSAFQSYANTLNQEDIDNLFDMLPIELRNMVDIQKHQKVSSPSHAWEQIKIWRSEADKLKKQLYLMIGRANYELPPTQTDDIFWVFIDNAATVSKDSPYLCCDFESILNTAKDNIHNFPEGIFDGIIFDFSTIKFFDGLGGIRPIYYNYEDAKSWFERGVTKQEILIKTLAHCLKSDGFIEILGEAQQTLIDNRHYLDIQQEFLTVFQGKALKFPFSLSMQLYKKYFYEEGFCYADFGKTLANHIIPSFGPTTEDMFFDDTNDYSEQLSYRKTFFASRPKVLNYTNWMRCREQLEELIETIKDNRIRNARKMHLKLLDWEFNSRKNIFIEPKLVNTLRLQIHSLMIMKDALMAEKDKKSLIFLQDFIDVFLSQNPLELTRINDLNIQNYCIPFGVTAIDNLMFQGCKSLFILEIPRTVNYIGNRALEECKSLTVIRINARNEDYDRILKMLPENFQEIAKKTTAANKNSVSTAGLFSDVGLFSEIPQEQLRPSLEEQGMTNNIN